MTNRAARRRLPKRELRKRYHRDINRIMKLGGEGVSPRAIAATLNLSTELVTLVLEETKTREKED